MLRYLSWITPYSYSVSLHYLVADKFTLVFIATLFYGSCSIAFWHCFRQAHAIITKQLSGIVLKNIRIGCKPESSYPPLIYKGKRKSCFVDMVYPAPESFSLMVKSASSVMPKFSNLLWYLKTLHDDLMVWFEM